MLLRSVLAAAGGALMLAGGFCSPALAVKPVAPDGRQAPVEQQAEPKPAEQPEKKPDCVTHQSGFKQNGDQPVYEVALENSCDMRLKCTIDLTVLGARGPAQGRGTLVLGPAANGQTTRKIYVLKVKSAGGMASLSQKCTKI
ncbi:MAG: hypothetical protein K2Z80_03440 [Xanthobacteraceae bacterium]|nr:hypothetical protein [Xanthobacteraceae bacterium]